MAISTQLSRISTTYRDFGLFDGALYVLARLMQQFSGGRLRLIRYYLLAQPVPWPFKAACPASPSSTVVEVLRHDSVNQNFPRDRAILDGRYAAGHRCFAAMVKGRFAGYIWLARGQYDEDEVCCRYVLERPDSSAWDFDVYVAPEFRMGRTFARLWDAANEILSLQGICWSFSRVSAFNPASIRSHARLGTHKLASATFLCIGDLQISITGRAPFVRICWSGRNPLRISLTPPADRTNEIAEVGKRDCRK